MLHQARLETGRFESLGMVSSQRTPSSTDARGQSERDVQCPCSDVVWYATRSEDPRPQCCPREWIAQRVLPTLI